MSIAILHNANPNSNSMQVVERVRSKTDAKCFAITDPDLPDDPRHDWIIVVPNYGDGEIQAGVESFLVGTRVSFRRFSILELGNYYGFDEWGYGAADKIHRLLAERQGEQFFSHLSMDTLPKMDWTTLDRWIAALTAEVGQDG